MDEAVISYLKEVLPARLGSRFRVLSVSPEGGGCISQALRLVTTHGAFFLKWNASFSPDLFVREAEGLQALKKAIGGEMVIPEVVLMGEVGEVPGFILLEFLEPGVVSHQEEKLGQGLAYLHRSRGTDFGFSHDNYCGATPQRNSWSDNWSTFFIQNRLLFLLKLIRDRRGINHAEQQIYDRLTDKLPDLLPDKSEPVLIHGDLWSGNYLYTTSGPALIDPASYFADREMELSMMTLFGGFSQCTWRAYQEAYPLEHGWEDRVQLYQLYHILNHYYLFGGFYGQQALAVAKKFI